jgi:hypothetical protein
LSKRNVLFALSGLFFVLIVVALCISPRQTPIDVSVTFIGFTNLSTPSVTAASFCVSNSGKVPVVQWPLCSPFDYKNQDPDIFSRHFGDVPIWNLAPLILKPGHVSKFSITYPPQHTAPWRVWFGFANAGWRMKLAGIPPRAQNFLSRFFPKKWLMIKPDIEIPSDWIADPQSKEPKSDADKWWEYPQSMRR